MFLLPWSALIEIAFMRLQRDQNGQRNFLTPFSQFPLKIRPTDHMIYSSLIFGLLARVRYILAGVDALDLIVH